MGGPGSGRRPGGRGKKGGFRINKKGKFFSTGKRTSKVKLNKGIGFKLFK